MKRLLVTTLLIASQTVFANVIQHQEVETYQQGVYKGSCYLTRPLYSYENCNSFSRIGADVAACAFASAIAQCERDGNLDCIAVEGSEIVWRKSSSDFPGYVKCQATAIVRGYR